MGKRKEHLTTLRFDGPRFEDHGLELDVLKDLIAYKRLLVGTAKELWRKANPDKPRLPKGFESSISLKFYELKQGSTAIPILRELDIEDAELELGPVDIVRNAAEIIEGAISSANRGEAAPENLPVDVVPLFEDFGATLQEDDSIEVGGDGRASVLYSHEVKARIATWHERTYVDNVDLVGEVRAADLDGLDFVLRLPGEKKVSGKFTDNQERMVTEALREHSCMRMHVVGKCEFSFRDRTMKKMVDITSMNVMSADESERMEVSKDLLDEIREISGRVPLDEWKRIPTDLSMNLHQYLYGKNTEAE